MNLDPIVITCFGRELRPHDANCSAGDDAESQTRSLVSAEFLTFFIRPPVVISSKPIRSVGPTECSCPRRWGCWICNPSTRVLKTTYCRRRRRLWSFRRCRWTRWRRRFGWSSWYVRGRWRNRYARWWTSRWNRRRRRRRYCRWWRTWKWRLKDRQSVFCRSGPVQCGVRRVNLQTIVVPDLDRKRQDVQSAVSGRG